MVALALGLFATSTFGQALVCTERVSENDGLNWYAGKWVSRIGGVDRLIYNPVVKFEPAGAYPIAYYFLSASGSPTSDSFSGTGEFRFPPQADGVEVQVHYQLAGDDWTAGETTATIGGQVVKCSKMVVPKGFMISFVIRVKVADTVPDGTPINVQLLGFSGLTGVVLGKIPEVQIVTYTGPWSMKWLKQPVIKTVRLEKSLGLLTFTVVAPPSIWTPGSWKLEGTSDFKHWVDVSAELVPSEGPERVVKVPVDNAKHHQFFRIVAVQ